MAKEDAISARFGDLIRKVKEEVDAIGRLIKEAEAIKKEHESTWKKRPVYYIIKLIKKKKDFGFDKIKEVYKKAENVYSSFVEPTKNEELRSMFYHDLRIMYGNVMAFEDYVCRELGEKYVGKPFALKEQVPRMGAVKDLIIKFLEKCAEFCKSVEEARKR